MARCKLKTKNVRKNKKANKCASRQKAAKASTVQKKLDNFAERKKGK